jgi:hypothetical protein
MAYIRWYGEQVAEAVKRAMYAGVLKAAAWLEREMVRSISTSGRAKGGGARSPVKNGPRPMKVYHSRPGQPPFSDTGKLRQSVFMDHDESQGMAVVGTSSLVGVYMELGVHGGVAIRPVNKKVLAFPGWVEKAASGNKGARSAWDWCFAHEVIQGAIAPRPWIRPAAYNNANQLASIVTTEAAHRLASQGISGSVISGSTIHISGSIGGAA